MEQLELYVVRNKEGKYLRSKGYGGYGKKWVDGIKTARIYTTIKPARAQVTFWSNTFPEYGVPDIVVLTMSETKVLNEEERVKNNKIKKELQEKASEKIRAKQNLSTAKRRLQEAEESYKKAEAKIEE